MGGQKLDRFIQFISEYIFWAMQQKIAAEEHGTQKIQYRTKSKVNVIYQCPELVDTLTAF